MGARKRAGLRPAIALKYSLGRSAPCLLAQPLGLGAGGLGRCAWAGLVGVGDRARGGDQPAGAAGRERRARAPRRRRPGRRCPGSRNGRVRHQLAQAREVLGLGRAGDGADVGEARAARSAELGDQSARAAPTAARRSRARGPAGRRRPGLDVRTSTNAPAALARAVVDQRLERVAAEQRVGGEGVGAEAVDGAERRRRAATPAPARRPRR